MRKAGDASASGARARAVLAHVRKVAVVARAAEVGRAFAEGRVQDGFKALRALRAASQGSKTQRPKQALVVQLEDSSPATSYTDSRRRWLRHFAQQEHGQIGDVRDVAIQLAERRRRQEYRGPIDFDVLVSLRELEAVFRAGASGRQPGLDGIVDCAFAAFPTELARLYHPLMVKLGFTVSEPLSFKGGRLSELYKGRGCRAVCDMHLQILVSGVAGKRWHKCIRNRLEPVLAAYAPGEVCSARHRGTDMGAHIPKAMQEWAAVRGLSCAAIVLDVTDAYHYVLRSLVCGPVLFDEDAAIILRGMGLPPGGHARAGRGRRGHGGHHRGRGF